MAHILCFTPKVAVPDRESSSQQSGYIYLVIGYSSGPANVSSALKIAVQDNSLDINLAARYCAYPASQHISQR